ncbi:MAG: LptF/LptG family permease [Candidatus Eremiobacteraeota bacterium]|nr:LptF/LptG family permease [Candidatus Eremiobacteraeota bacterium]
MATVRELRAAPLVPMQPLLRIPILDAYVLREIVPPFAFALAAYVLFWFINIFFLAADYIINAHAPFFLVLRFLVFRVPQSTPLAFPFASLFSALLAFSRLAQDNEINALRTSGVTFLRICRTPLLFGLAVFGLAYYINETIAPVTTDLSTRSFYQIIYHTDQLPIEPGFFRKDDATGNVYYIGNLSSDKRVLQNVMIFENATTSQFRTVVTAQTGYVVGQSLHLVKAAVSTFKTTGEVHGNAVHRDIDIGLPLGESIEQFANSTTNDPYTVNSKQLKAQIGAMQATGQGGQTLDTLKITLAQRLAFPFASFIAVVLALPLAAQIGKKGKNLGTALGIALSVLLLFVYYIMMSAFAALGKNDAINPFLAAWAPNLIMGGAGVLMFWRVER